MKNLIVALALLGCGVGLLPAQADDVARGKVPFMTELDNGRKFYVRGAHRQVASRVYTTRYTKTKTHTVTKHRVF